MRERLGKSGSLIDFQQQIGDPRGRELMIEIVHEIHGPFGRVGPQLVDVQLAGLDDSAWDRAGSGRPAKQIGRASCSDRVCQYGLITVVAVSLNKKTNNN